MNVDALERQLATEQQAARDRYAAIAETAQAENRERTDEERAEVTALVDKANKTKAQIARARGDSEMLATIERLTTPAPTPTNGDGLARRPRVSLGQQFVQSAGYDFFKKGLHRTQSAWRSPSVELFDPGPGLYATTLTGDPASGGALLVPQYLPGIQPLPTKRLVIADLFAQGTAESNAVVYMRETTFTNAAAPVAEGAAKPESTLVFEQAQDPVRKIAHWLPVSEEMLEDVAQIQSYIDARLRLGVQIEEEDQLLNGTGVAPELTGLLTRAGLAPDVAVTGTAADAILQQIMAIASTAFLMPDGIVVNPADWSQILLTKSDDGSYLTAGPFSAIQTATLWGLPVAVTPSIAAGTAVVGAFKTGAQIFRKGGIRVEASNSHADFFIKNLVAIRAEERLALAVYRPAAFGKVTGLGGSP